MDNKHTVNDIKNLRPVEQVLAYLHRNNIPLTPDNLAAHQEQIQADLNIPHFSSDILDYLSDGTWEYRESDIKVNILKDKRVDLFLHPRFAPTSIHSHSYFEIKYLLGGSANVLIAGQSITLEAGDLVFIAPEVEHMVAIYDTDSLLINIIITPNAAASAFPRIYFSENPLSRFFNSALQGKQEQTHLICHTGSSEAVHHLILDAYHKCDCPGAVPSSLLCESIVEYLMLEVLSSHADDFEQTDCSPSFPEKLFPILSYINDSCASVSLTTLAKAFNYSPAHLSRLIKQYTGKSFSELLRSARLTQASILLRSSDLSIQEVMLRTGYTGKAHFYRVFQETYGMTPAQFRARKESAK